MSRIMVRISCLMVLLASAAVALGQVEFSADVVQNKKEALSKVYFGKNKLRFDGADNNDRAGGGSFIVDLTTDSYLVLMPKQHMYMEMPSKMMENRGAFHFFQSGDVENACADWQKLTTNQGGTCRKVGNEMVNGRNTVKYTGTNSKGETGTWWLDSKLRFPVKWEEKNGGGEMQNIKEGPQPASLFEIPAGYTKMDMGGMMQRPQ